MRRLGICSKCGIETVVQDHHYKGYDVDDVLPYCKSCDTKAHNKARREGKCNLTGDESHKKSTASHAKRTWKSLTLSSKTLEPNTLLFEVLQLNLNTNNIVIWSGFSGNHHKKLKVINEKE